VIAVLRRLLRPLFLLILVGVAPAQVRVVTTIPDLADLTRELGGSRVEVTSIAKGRENLHAVRLKPSHIVATSRADLFVQVGLSLEHAWVPGLLRAARNKRVQPGGEGFVNASEGWKAIQVPETIDRRQGADVHPQGNPHVNLDPRGGPQMMRCILAGLLRVDPAGKAHYDARFEAWKERYAAAAERWAKIQAALKGESAVTYHQEFDYLLRACGIRLFGSIEPKPGIPPTVRHLSTLITGMRREEVKVVLTASWSKGKHVGKVARETDAALLELPTMVGANERSQGWIEMMDELHRRLAEAYGVEVADD